MVRHNFTYPLGHILTASYWQQVRDGGLHLTVSDTGWAKSAWGKIYGQWLAGAAVFVYDYDKFVPKDLLQVIAEYGVTTFCAPPTIYRYLIKEDLSQYDLSSLELRRHRRRAPEPGGLQPVPAPDRASSCGKATARPRCTVAIGHLPLDGAPARAPWACPRPGYDIDLVDDDGRSCEVGEVGEIVFRTDQGSPGGHVRRLLPGPGADRAAPGTTASTTPATPPGGTRTATTGSWAARTT